MTRAEVGVGAFFVLGMVIASRLDDDALAMAVGVVFGVVAMVPTALLALAGSKRRRADDGDMPPAQPTIVNHYHAHLHLPAGEQQTTALTSRHKPAAYVVSRLNTLEGEYHE